MAVAEAPERFGLAGMQGFQQILGALTLLFEVRLCRQIGGIRM
jgi:hypothetical protein